MTIHNPDNYSSATLLRLLILRIASIGLYLSAYRNIKSITDLAVDLYRDQLPLFLIASRAEVLLNPKEPLLKTFTLIVLFTTTLVPIIRNLLKEIDTDTIFFWFGICQAIFCIDSIRASIFSRSQKARRFDRNEVLLLEESILIPLKIESNGVVGSIAALLGFFGTFSRIEDNTQVLLLLAIGFTIYHFVPHILERRLVHRSTPMLAGLVVLQLAVQFLFDEGRFHIFLYLIISLVFLWMLTTKMINFKMSNPHMVAGMAT